MHAPGRTASRCYDMHVNLPHSQQHPRSQEDAPCLSEQQCDHYYQFSDRGTTSVGVHDICAVSKETVLSTTAVIAEVHERNACTHASTELRVHAGNGMLTVALKMLQRVRVCLPLTAVRSMVSCKLYTPLQERMCRVSMHKEEACVPMHTWLHGHSNWCHDRDSFQVTAGQVDRWFSACR